MKKQQGKAYRDKISILRKQTIEAIEASQKSSQMQDSLYLELAQSIEELEEMSTHILAEGEKSDLFYNAQLIYNMIEEPIHPIVAPHKSISMLGAAKCYLESKNMLEIHDVVLSCALNPNQCNVLLSDLKQICDSIDDALEELED